MSQPKHLDKGQSKQINSTYNSSNAVSQVQL